MLWWIKVFNSELTLASLLWGFLFFSFFFFKHDAHYWVQLEETASNDNCPATLCKATIVYAMFTPKLPNALDITKATLSLIIKGCFLQIGRAHV